MRYRLLLFLYLVFLVVMISVPLGTSILSDTYVSGLRLDYLVHVLVFAPVVVLWRLGFSGHPLWKIAGVGVLLALILEGLQYVLPYRNGNMTDAVANIAGVGVGCLVLGGWAWWKWWK